MTQLEQKRLYDRQFYQRHRKRIIKKVQKWRKKPGNRGKVNATKRAREANIVPYVIPIDPEYIDMGLTIVTKDRHVNPIFIVHLNNTFTRESLADPLPRW